VSASLSNYYSEFVFTTSRSSGPGGQNVNKVNSKVTLSWNINESALSDDEKNVIITKLASIITKDGVLMLTSQEKRSQLQNKEEVIKKLEKLLVKAFAKKKVRKPSKPSKAAKQKRIGEKKKAGEKKKWRQKGFDD